MELVEEHSKDVKVEVCGSHVLPDGFQDAADDEDVVADCQASEHSVEDVGHLVAEQDWDSNTVGNESKASNDDLAYSFKPPSKLIVELHLLLSWTLTYQLSILIQYPKELSCVLHCGFWSVIGFMFTLASIIPKESLMENKKCDYH